MDPVSDVLSDLRADRVVTGRFSLAAPWAFRKSAVTGAPFRICVGNPFFIVLQGMKPVRVEPDDFILLPHGHEHVMCSSLEVAPISFDTLMSNNGIQPRFDMPLSFSISGPGVISELYTGIIVFRDLERNPFLSMLPPLIHIRAGDTAIAPWLLNTLTSFIQESMAAQPGWSIAAARLADILFVHLLRAQLLNAGRSNKGWLRGMADWQIGKAMAMIHRDPRREWDVASLATEAGMSRSRFSARFVQLVGETPIAHLTAYRMYLAAGQLMLGKRRLVEVAESVGYSSDKAFNRAFRRWSGLPPRTYARSAPDLFDLERREVSQSRNA
ncbi:AraC family transcriptional regulator [Paraburkholderia antibiotica]|uniref:AraC family transcriptional regulator n=1 Tax=Paraburkholderia antibiotica TaxID=2728839 RepID=A0A7X9ZZF8_9BURK|nr:AraC family transcriptional regulator [Paraburkholderia antibiotica]NML32950.1 AraC family transcriptional regulator [Paraburkholderia antibiotica]